jgi:L-aspartate oxidase
MIAHARYEIKRLMWDYVGIVRTSARLKKAEERLRELNSDVEEMRESLPPGSRLLELRNLAAVSRLITTSASMREESRGLHYNRDFPEIDEVNWRRDTVLENDASGSAG